MSRLRRQSLPHCRVTTRSLQQGMQRCEFQVPGSQAPSHTVWKTQDLGTQLRSKSASCSRTFSVSAWRSPRPEKAKSEYVGCTVPSAQGGRRLAFEVQDGLQKNHSESFGSPLPLSDHFILGRIAFAGMKETSVKPAILSGSGDRSSRISDQPVHAESHSQDPVPSRAATALRRFRSRTRGAWRSVAPARTAFQLLPPVNPCPCTQQVSPRTRQGHVRSICHQGQKHKRLTYLQMHTKACTTRSWYYTSFLTNLPHAKTTQKQAAQCLAKTGRRTEGLTMEMCERVQVKSKAKHIMGCSYQTQSGPPQVEICFLQGMYVIQYQEQLISV